MSGDIISFYFQRKDSLGIFRDIEILMGKKILLLGFQRPEKKLNKNKILRKIFFVHFPQCLFQSFASKAMD